MSRRLPRELMKKPNDTPLVMDRHNVSHRPGTPGRSACGLTGSPVTLAQSIAWGSLWCAHVACYEPPYPSRGSR